MAKAENLYLPPVFDVIKDNMRKSGNPMGLKPTDCASWASKLEIPTTAHLILYTGCEYQMIPYMEGLLDALKKVKFEDTVFSLFRSTQATFRKVGLDLARTYARVSSAQKETFDRLLQMAALTLRELGVDFAYWSDELYSGALLYEYGFSEEFQRHARKVVAQLKERGADAKTLLVISPHSAEVFTEVYRSLFEDFDVAVVTYPEFLFDIIRRSGRKLSLGRPMTVTLHDPCRLARSLGVTEQPREILKSIEGLQLKEALMNRRLTTCCGAPCEVVYPELSELQASRRIDELCETGAEAVVTLCPYCYASLRRGLNSAKTQIKVIDFIEVIYNALGGV